MPPKAANKKIVAARRHLSLITHHPSRITFLTNHRRKPTPCTQISILTSHILSHKKKESAPSREIRQSAEGCTFPTEPLSPFWPCGRAAKILEIMNKSSVSRTFLFPRYTSGMAGTVRDLPGKVKPTRIDSEGTGAYEAKF